MGSPCETKAAFVTGAGSAVLRICIRILIFILILILIIEGAFCAFFARILRAAAVRPILLFGSVRMMRLRRFCTRLVHPLRQANPGAVQDLKTEPGVSVQTSCSLLVLVMDIIPQKSHGALFSPPSTEEIQSPEPANPWAARVSGLAVSEIIELLPLDKV